MICSYVQVSDDEGEAALSPRKKPPSLSLTHTLIKAADQSYMFTQSGTIFVNGFKAGIGIEGIQSTNSRRFSKKLKLPMKDRLVLLSQLGHGASGVVYKAFDLVEMKIVALKMISVFEQ